MTITMNRPVVDVNRSAHPRAERGAIGVLGVDWTETDLGELQSLAELLQTLPTTVRCLEYAHCLGRSQEVTPVNVYRRMRMRVRQMENTLQYLGGNLEEIQVRFYVTRRGTKPTVETLYCSPTVNRGFSPRLQGYLRRNRLVHQAAVLAEPQTVAAGDNEDINNNNNNADTRTLTTRHNAGKEHHATWGRAMMRLVEIRDLDVSASAMFTLLQKCSDYVQPKSP